MELESDKLIADFSSACASSGRAPRDVAVGLYKTYTSKIKVRKPSFLNQALGVNGLSYDVAMVLKSYIEETKNQKQEH